MNKSSSTVDPVKPAEAPKRGSNKRQHHQQQQQHQQQQSQQQQHQENQDVIRESGHLETNKINSTSNDDMSSHNKLCKTEPGTIDEPAIPSKSSNDIAQEMIFKDVQDILDNDLSCAICQDIYVNPLILNCSHSFCKFCVYKWLSKKKGCPQCRVRVTFQAENLALRNIINKMVSKSPVQFRETRDVVVKQRLNEEQQLEKEGLPPVLRKRDPHYDDDQYMGLENFANRINIRFLNDNDPERYYHDSDDDDDIVSIEHTVNNHDDDDDDDDDEDLSDDSGSSDDESYGHPDMFDARSFEWEDLEDSDDVSFHMNGDNSTSSSDDSSDSEDEIIESDDDGEHAFTDDSSIPSSMASGDGERNSRSPIDIQEIHDDNDDIAEVEYDRDDSDVSMVEEEDNEQDRCSDDSTVEYDNNDSDESNSGFFRNSDTEIDEDYWD